MSILTRFNSLPPSGFDPADSLTLSRAHPRDFHALARFHYRAAPPATVDLILTLRDDEGPVACLVISRPTLNSWWRPRAWPDLARPTRRAAAHALNQHLRTISRVIVDPRWRGLGIARRLVRAYLDEPLTPATEAAAAMGACCPFFAAAGMTEYRLGPRRHAARLADALEHLGLSPVDLACWERTRPIPALLERETLTREDIAVLARGGTLPPRVSGAAGMPVITPAPAAPEPRRTPGLIGGPEPSPA